MLLLSVSLLSGDALAQAPTSGEVVISEMMMDPAFHGSAEWVELWNTTGSTRSLNGCHLVDTHFEDGVWKGAFQTFPHPDFGVVDLEIPGDGRITVAKNATFADPTYDGLTRCVAYDSSGVGRQCIAEAADMFKGSFFLGQSDKDQEQLCLVCGDEPVLGSDVDPCVANLVDRVPQDWETLSAYCPLPDGENCTANLSPAAQSGDPASANDDLASWCVAVDSTYYDFGYEDLEPAGLEARGTPGEPGSCGSFSDSPAEGEVIFTEIMGTPQAMPEYLELTNTADSLRSLDLCTLTKESLALGDSGEPDVDTTRLLGGITVEAGASVLLIKGDTCLAWNEDGSCPAGFEGFAYETLSFTSSKDETLSLSCPSAGGSDVLVDSFSYNFEVQGAPSGHSLMLEPDSADAESNDDPNAWCFAGFDQEFFDAGEGDCNFGSPGTVSECTTSVRPPPEGFVLRCTTGAPPALAGTLLGLLGLLALRRREED